MIIGISGRKGSGKTTLAEGLAPYLGDCSVIGFADPIKETCQELYPDVPFDAWWGDDAEKSKSRPELQGHSAREVMQQFSVFRRYDPLCWTRIGIDDASVYLHCIIADVRFPDEVKAIQEAGGVVIRLLRNPLPDDTHESEHALVRYDGFDMTIGGGWDAHQTLQQAIRFLRHKRVELWRV